MRLLASTSQWGDLHIILFALPLRPGIENARELSLQVGSPSLLQDEKHIKRGTSHLHFLSLLTAVLQTGRRAFPYVRERCLARCSPNLMACVTVGLCRDFKTEWKATSHSFDPGSKMIVGRSVRICFNWIWQGRKPDTCIVFLIDGPQ